MPVYVWEVLDTHGVLPKRNVCVLGKKPASCNLRRQRASVVLDTHGASHPRSACVCGRNPAASSPQPFVVQTSTVVFRALVTHGAQRKTNASVCGKPNARTKTLRLVPHPPRAWDPLGTPGVKPNPSVSAPGRNRATIRLQLLVPQTIRDVTAVLATNGVKPSPSACEAGRKSANPLRQRQQPPVRL
eukprot:PhF_6_TR32384/c0_g1_i1/m.48030